MKRFLLIASVAAALLAIPVTHTATAEEGGNSANRGCKLFEELAPRLFYAFYDSHGDCVSEFRSNGSDDIAHWCQDASESPFFPWNNVGQCVKFWNQFK